MKIWLVLPPKSSGYPMPQPDEGWWMPLGILSVGSYLLADAKIPKKELELEIIDGEIMHYREIENKIQFSDADIIGPELRNASNIVILIEAKNPVGRATCFGILRLRLRMTAGQVLGTGPFFAFLQKMDLSLKK